MPLWLSVFPAIGEFFNRNVVSSLFAITRIDSACHDSNTAGAIGLGERINVRYRLPVWTDLCEETVSWPCPL